MHYRLKSLHFVVDIPIYKQTALFVFGCDKKKLAKIVEDLGGSEKFVLELLSMDKCSGYTYQDGDTGKFLVYMPGLPQRASEHGILVHEIFHLVEQIMNRIGMPLVIYTSSEAYAYLIGHISAEVFSRLWNTQNQSKQAKG